MLSNLNILNLYRPKFLNYNLGEIQNTALNVLLTDSETKLRNTPFLAKTNTME